jgi:hypothetical protein
MRIGTVRKWTAASLGEQRARLLFGRCVQEWAEGPDGDRREVRRPKTSEDLPCPST